MIRQDAAPKLFLVLARNTVIFARSLRRSELACPRMLETFGIRYAAVLLHGPLLSGYFYRPAVLIFRNSCGVAAGPSSLERAQSGPKGLGMACGAGQISLEGTRRSCRTDGGKTDPYLASLWPHRWLVVGASPQPPSR